MKITKKKLMEIIDKNNNLIDDEDVPESGANLETSANSTTDYNRELNTQPFKYSMLGRFGFTMLPFFEGKGDENKEHNSKILEELSSFLFEKYKEILKFYFKNPNKIKSDYNKVLKQDEVINEKYGTEFAKEVLNIINPFYEGALKELDDKLKENIDESSFIEGRVLDKKEKKDFTRKKKNFEVLDKKIEKLAGLISKKLDPEIVDKLIVLLEKK